jgi:hypothetical protein
MSGKRPLCLYPHVSLGLLTWAMAQATEGIPHPPTSPSSWHIQLSHPPTMGPARGSFVPLLGL